VRRLAKHTRRCHGLARSERALVFRLFEIANKSCSRSRTDAGAAIRSVYQIKPSGATPRAESQARQKRAAQHNGSGEQHRL